MRAGAHHAEPALAQILAQDALQKGHSVRFSTLANTLADLLEQESLPAVERRLRRVATPDLLVLSAKAAGGDRRPRHRPANPCSRILGFA